MTASSNTANLITLGIRQNLVRFAADPYADTGTICRIGDDWFYFGGKTAAKTAPETYLKTVGIDKAVQQITEALIDLAHDNPKEYRYYIHYLENHLHLSPSHPWAEIRCNYMDEEDRFWRVDAWKTDNDNEEGHVIAYIDDITGRVLYTDPLARVDTTAQEIITNMQKQILEHKILVSLDASKKPLLHIKTDNGTMIAETETKEDTGFDSVFISFKDEKDNIKDLVAIRMKENINLYLWEEPEYEDPTIKSVIYTEDLLENME